MPIQLEKTTPQQVTASIHVVTAAKADFLSSEARLTIKSYSSRQARDSGASALLTRRRSLRGETYNEYFSRSVLQEQGKDPITQAEKYLINTSEFKGGTIVE